MGIGGHFLFLARSGAQLIVTIIVTCCFQHQGDITKLLGHSHSLLSETYASEMENILKSTEVRAVLVVIDSVVHLGSVLVTHVGASSIS